MKPLQKIYASKFWWLLLLGILFVVNYAASRIHARADLTKEKRYTLSSATKKLVADMDDKAEISVFLKGDFPSGFRKLANSTKEFLQLLREVNNRKIQFRFISPDEQMPGLHKTYGDTLVALGATPINLTVQKKAGESNTIIFPVTLIKYKDREALVNLYPGASGRISQEEINSAEALMEYQFAKTLDKLSNPSRPGVAYAGGNGEPMDDRTYKMREALSSEYKFGVLDLNTNPVIPPDVNVLLMVKPTIPFSEDELLKLDQFVMHGGKLLCFIDALIAEQDSLAFKTQTIAYDRNLNLTNLFFKYGLRINTDLVMDLQCDVIPFMVGGNSSNPQIEFLHWNYFPFLTAENKIAAISGYVSGRFVNSIDTIRVNGVRKTPLLVSSPNSRIINTPALISLNENKNVPEDALFKRNAIPVAMLLEGNFTSLYQHRISQVQKDSLQSHKQDYLESSTENKIIVVADGDMVLNDYITPNGPGTIPEPIEMGWNKYTYTEYLKQSESGKLFMPVANRDFLLNCVEYLTGNDAVNETRNKDIVLRLLDSKKLNAQKSKWQIINIALPLLLVLLAGFIYQQIRKRKFQ